MSLSLNRSEFLLFGKEIMQFLYITKKDITYLLRILDWLYEYGVLTPFSKVFHLCRGDQCTYPCFPGDLKTSAPHNYSFQATGCFPT